MRRVALLSAGFVLLARSAAGQSSEFGVRALGLPSLPVSVRSHGAGGGFALFDAESPVNPASLVFVGRPTATFTLLHSWRTSENPFGRATGNDTQFPLFFAAGLIGRRMVGSVSASVYTDRTFALALEDTLTLRGEEVVVYDTLFSRGGVSDLRVAAAYSVSSRLAVGLGLHLLTGSNRFDSRRRHSDSTYAPVRVVNELSFAGLGLSVGAVLQPTRSLQLAGFLRLDGDLQIEKDTADLGELNLPRTMGGGLQWAPTRRLLAAGHVITQSWSRLDGDLKDRGGVGAVNTTRLGGGLEWLRDGTNPARFPVRLGVRFDELPFPPSEGVGAGRERAVSLGTGFRFAGGRGSLDLALERVWRDEGGFRERALALKLGVGVRP
jgi:hypothetical protein